MKEQLKSVSKSYDKAIEYGKKGIDLYKDLPEYIKNDPDYLLYEKLQVDGSYQDSAKPEIFDYLAPKKNMKFIDLGCCLNLMFRGYDLWSSTYYGVDISPKTIHLLNNYVQKKALSIGSLFCGSMHETPYDNNFFDIGACIGSLEYFETDFVEKAVIEFHRILKPAGKFVLDIPNIGSPECRIAMMIEEYLGRTDKFSMSKKEFELLIEPYFTIDKKVDTGCMMEYFLICKK